MTFSSPLTYVFDVHGLIDYPQFVPMVIRPLEVLGATPWFWSRAPWEDAAEELRSVELDDYVPSLVAAEQTTFFRTALQRSLRESAFGTLLHLPQCTEHAYTHLAEALNKLGLPAYPDRTHALLVKGTEWLHLSKETGAYLKFPPLVASRGPCLFVESDNVHWSEHDKTRLSEHGYHFQELQTLAERCSFSLLYTPEYPGIWEDHQLPLSAQEILESIAQRILEWKGEFFTAAVGLETGLYQEGSPTYPERR